MKLLFSHKTMLALAVAAATAVGCATHADEPAPPSESQAALPPGIAPDSQLAQVFKLVQAGMDAGVIKSFVENSSGAFELDADKIIALKDEGVPSDIINTMMDHDKKFYAAAAATPPPPAPLTSPATELAPPTTQVTVTYFNDTLTPYGSWVEVEGYGRCWRPTVVNYDTSWRPYCDRGHWVYTDCGWYWDSEYSWGSTFHYGRWFRHSRFGWCWYPDTEWAPSWVTFRSNNDYCGWAPLPPHAVYRPGAGFFYRGASVSVGFDFGLDAACFTFVAPSHFCERRPRYYCAEPERVNRFFHETTVVNNYNIHNTTIVNNGIPVQRISTETHRPIQPVNVAAIPNATRHGWRGDDANRPGRSDNHNNNAAGNFSSGNAQPGQGQNRRGDQRNSGSPANGVSTTHSSSPSATVDHNANGDRNGQRDRENSGRKPQTQAKPLIGAPVDNPSVPSAAADRNANSDRNNSHERDNSVRRSPPQAKPVVGAPVENQSVYQRNNAAGNVSVQQPQTAMPSANNVAPDRIQRPNNSPPTSSERIQSENNSRIPREQPRQFNTVPAAPVTSAPQNNWRQNRNTESPVITAPVTHSAPQAEPRQTVQQREMQHESRRTAVEPAPRSFTPAPAPAPAPSPAAAPSQSHGSDRGRNSDKDKP